MAPSLSYVTKSSPVSYSDQATQGPSNCPSTVSKSVAETLLKGVFLEGHVFDRKHLGINAEKDLEGSLEYVVTCQIIQKEIIRLEGVFEALDTVSNCSSEITVPQFLLGLWGYIPLKNTSEERVTEAMIKICYKLYVIYNIHCGNYIQKLAEHIQCHLKQDGSMEDKMDSFDERNNISLDDEWFWEHLEKERLPRSEKYFNSDQFTYGDMTFTNEVLHFCVWYRMLLIDFQTSYRRCQSTLEAIINPCQNIPVLRDSDNLKCSQKLSKNCNESPSESGFIESDWTQEIRSTDMHKKSKKNRKMSPQQMNFKKIQAISQPLSSWDEGTIVRRDDVFAVETTEITHDSGVEGSFSSVDRTDNWFAVGATEITHDSGIEESFRSLVREDLFSFDFSSVTKLKNLLDTDGSLQKALPKTERRRKEGEKKLKTKMMKSKTTKYVQSATSLAPDMSFCFPINVVERCK